MENDTKVSLGLQVPEPADLAPYIGGAVFLPTFGGRLSVQWDPNARVTSVAGLAHFGAFLSSTGLFDRLAEDAPFDYKSNNACSKRDFLATVLTWRLIKAFTAAKLLDDLTYRRVLKNLKRAKKAKFNDERWQLIKVNPSVERMLASLGLDTSAGADETGNV